MKCLKPPPSIMDIGRRTRYHMINMDAYQTKTKFSTNQCQFMDKYNVIMITNKINSVDKRYGMKQSLQLTSYILCNRCRTVKKISWYIYPIIVHSRFYLSDIIDLSTMSFGSFFATKNMIIPNGPWCHKSVSNKWRWG